LHTIIWFSCHPASENPSADRHRAQSGCYCFRQLSQNGTLNPEQILDAGVRSGFRNTTLMIADASGSNAQETCQETCSGRRLQIRYTSADPAGLASSPAWAMQSFCEKGKARPQCRGQAAPCARAKLPLSMGTSFSILVRVIHLASSTSPNAVSLQWQWWCFRAGWAWEVGGGAGRHLGASRRCGCLPAAGASGLEINGINLRANESKCAYLLCQRMICMICTHRTAPFVHTPTHNPCNVGLCKMCLRALPRSTH